jgi:hypothetical protein
MGNAKNDNLLSGRVPDPSVIPRFYETLPYPRKQVGAALQVCAELWIALTDDVRKLLLSKILDVKDVAPRISEALGQPGPLSSQQAKYMTEVLAASDERVAISEARTEELERRLSALEDSLVDVLASKAKKGSRSTRRKDAG